jgi:hypothetical protein
MESFLGDMLLIYPVLGVTAFEKIDEASQTAPTERLVLRGKDAQGEGQETSDGFVVFKDAVARSDVVPSFHAHGRELRESLVEAGVFAVEGQGLRLTQDYVFGSPSLAAMVLLGRTANGRIEWKTTSGSTLKELQERALEQS